MAKSYAFRPVVFMIAFLSSIGLIAQDAYISSVSVPRYIKASTNYQISLRIKNASPTFITSFSVRWRLDGGAWQNGNTVNITAPGLGSGNSYMPHTHQVPLNTTQGPHTLELNIVLASDINQSNNSMTIPLTALNNWAEKVVLLEARTETWCQYCPTSNTTTNGLLANPDLAVVKFHLSDALNACSECITYYNQYYSPTFTPSGMIDMSEYGTYVLNSNHPAWEAELTARAAGVSPVNLTMTSSVNMTTRVMSVTLNATFTYAVTGPFRLNVYVAEDNVPGPQTNASANYIHQRVMRSMLGGAQSTSSTIPTNPVVGTTYTQIYTWTVPTTYDINDLYLVGMCEHRPTSAVTDRYALNAVNRKAIGVGIEEFDISNTLSISPNPFVDDVRVHLEGATGNVMASLFALDGRVVVQRSLSLDAQGYALFELGDATLPTGTYVLQLVTPHSMARQKLVKTD